MHDSDKEKLRELLGVLDSNYRILLQQMELASDLLNELIESNSLPNGQTDEAVKGAKFRVNAPLLIAQHDN